MSSIFLPPNQTRLVTITAHVDHGKTTLADNLIEHNGLISERLAGTLRYLDSDPEEQRRGITMRSSAIGLKHTYTVPRQTKQAQEMIVHLVDSPGHTDFSMEVKSALLACDATLIVIDAVEGMGARTHQLLRDSHAHQLVPVLVVNKIDRLCTELCLSPTEAYLRLRSLLEIVNAAAAATLTSAHTMQETTDDEQRKREEDLWTFDPAKGNVVFCSALFGWGFTVQSLARSLFRNNTIAIKPMLLKQYLFGDFKIRDAEKVVKWKSGSEDQPIFAEYALQPIFQVYEGVAAAAAASGAGTSMFADGRGNGARQNKSDSSIKADTPGMDEVLAAMSVAPTGAHAPRSIDDLKLMLSTTGANTDEAILRAVLRRYRPLSDSILDTIVEYCPSPAEAAASVRTGALALTEPLKMSEEFEKIRQSVKECSQNDDAPVVAHVCKFMMVDKLHIRDPQLSTNNDNILLGIGRVLSGRLRTGDEYFAMGPKHSYGKEVQKKGVRLYLLMGSSFVLVNEVPAGHLCAIYNLEDLQLKTLTLCSDIHGMPLKGFERGIRPLVKVNIETDEAADMDLLERGLVKLTLADSAVEVTATAKGERILACLGELHLEQSLLDLQQVYCGKKMKLRISDPIVDFGETTDWFENEAQYESFLKDDIRRPLRQTKIPPYCEEEGLPNARFGRARAVLSGQGAAISLRVIPLAPLVYDSLKTGTVVEGAGEDLKFTGEALGITAAEAQRDPNSILKCLAAYILHLDANGNALMESSWVNDGRCVVGIEASNSKVFPGSSENLDRTNGDQTKKASYESDNQQHKEVEAVIHGEAQYADLRDRIFCFAREHSNPDMHGPQGEADCVAFKTWTNEMKGSAVAGFQMATRAGPICEEPMRNILVILEGVEVAVNLSDTGSADNNVSGGMVVAALRSGIRAALLTRPIRLMESHLKLTLHSSLSAMGPLYNVVSRRRGRVLDDSIVEGTDLLMITASIPQAESFGIGPELLKQTSGEVTVPEMIFSKWERLDVDPFWIPTTEEEREDFGELQQAGDSSTGVDNTALKYIRHVRLRKGLTVDSARTVIAAEKQRTLKK